MRTKEYTKNHSSQVCISRVFFIIMIILIVIAAAVQPIVAYAQPSLSEKWDYQDVLVLGVGADWNAAEVKELLNNLIK